MGALLFVLHACLRRLSCSAGITSLVVVLIACSTLAAEAPAAPGRVLVLDNQDNYLAGYQTDYLLHPFAETFEAIRYAVPDSAWQPNAKALISLGYQQDVTSPVLPLLSISQYSSPVTGQPARDWPAVCAISRWPSAYQPRISGASLPTAW